MLMNKCIKRLDLELINISETVQKKLEKEKVSNKARIIINNVKEKIKIANKV